MPDTDKNVGQKILRRQTIQTVAMTVLALALIVAVVVVSVRLSNINKALCTFKNDLISRKVQSQEFLKDHPHGAFGFSPAQIQQGIDNYKRTIDALRSVSCPPPPTV